MVVRREAPGFYEIYYCGSYLSPNVTARYERLCEDLRDKGYNTMNLPFEVGCRGVINARNHLVLEDICNLVRIRARKKLIGSLGRIALLGSYRIWLARYSQEWSGGELIR